MSFDKVNHGVHFRLYNSDNHHVYFTQSTFVFENNQIILQVSFKRDSSGLILSNCTVLLCVLIHSRILHVLMDINMCHYIALCITQLWLVLAVTKIDSSVVRFTQRLDPTTICLCLVALSQLITSCVCWGIGYEVFTVVSACYKQTINEIFVWCKRLTLDLTAKWICDGRWSKW